MYRMFSLILPIDVNDSSIFKRVVHQRMYTTFFFYICYQDGYPQKLSKNSGTISSWYEIKRITMCRYFNLMFQANDSWKNFLYTMECENLHFTFSVLIVKELLENLYVEKQFNEPHPRRKSNNKIQSNSRSNFKQTYRCWLTTWISNIRSQCILENPITICFHVRSW